MALLPYRSVQNVKNRSRSSSCSSPIKKEFFYLATCSDGLNTLVRSYTCSQIFKTDKTGQTYQNTQIKIFNFITPKKGVRLSDDGTILTGHAKSEKPFRDSDNIHNQSAFVLDQKIAKCKSSRKKLLRNERNLPKKAFKYGVLSVLLGILGHWYFFMRECNYVWDSQLTSEKLAENVFGQTDAVAKVNSVLSMLNNSNDLYVMLFTGSVGVGKTFTSSIISQNFPWSSNKLITKLTSSKTTEIILDTFSKCGSNLITVDDLSINDINEAINLISLVTSKRKHQKALLILIFTVHTEAEKKLIFSEFNSAYINYFHIPFKDLDRDAIEKCFLVEIENQKVNIPEKELNLLIKNQMRDIDIVQGRVGCKGVAEKVVFYAAKH